MPGLSGASARRVIELIITGDSASAVRALSATAAASEDASAKMKRAGEAAGIAGRGLLGVTAPLLAVGAAGAKMAMTFQSSMEMIHTQAGASQQEVNKLSQSVLGLGGQVAQSPNELAEGLFHIESLGMRGAKALGVLKTAAQGAAIGGSDLTDTVTALGSAVQAGIRGTGNFSHAMALMNAAVGAGDMHMQDFAEAMGPALGAMSVYHASLKDTGAALAVFGDLNVRGAAAGTRWAQALRVMAAPSMAAQKQFASIGLSSTQLASDIRGPGGMLKALQDLHKALAPLSQPEQALKLTEMFGAKQAQGVMALESHISLYASKLRREQGGIANWSKDNAATQQMAAYKLKAAWGEVSSAMIRLGSVVLPIAGTAFHLLAAAVSPILNLFSKLPAPIRDAVGVFTALLTVVGVGGIAIEKGIKIWQSWQKVIAFAKDSTILQTLATKLFGQTATTTVGPAAELTAANERLAASFQAIRTSAEEAGLALRAEGAAAVTTSAENAEAGGGGLLGRLGMGGAGLGLAGGTLGALGGVAGLAYLVGHFLPTRTAKPRYTSAGTRASPLAITPSGRFHEGGLVPRHFATGGAVDPAAPFDAPMGADTVPAWLTPGEFVLNSTAAQQIGAAGLNRMNTTGQPAGSKITIEPGQTIVKISDRQVAEAVTRYVLRRAARGPSNLVGGQLASSIVGPPYAQP